MKSAIILHGMPSKEDYMNPNKDAQSNCHWLPWIQQQLLARGVLAQTPEFPIPYEPVYEDWKSVFERFEINETTILIGHSCGAGFLIRWLSESKRRVGKVVLVAPWIDLKKELKTGFFDFQIDSKLRELTESLVVFISDDDDQEMLTTVGILNASCPDIKIIRMKDKGHFTLKGMGTREFPELKNFLLD